MRQLELAKGHSYISVFPSVKHASHRVSKSGATVSLMNRTESNSALYLANAATIELQPPGEGYAGTGQSTAN